MFFYSRQLSYFKRKQRSMLQNYGFRAFWQRHEQHKKAVFTNFFGEPTNNLLIQFWFDVFQKQYNELATIPFFDQQITFSKTKQPWSDLLLNYKNNNSFDDYLKTHDYFQDFYVHLFWEKMYFEYQELLYSFLLLQIKRNETSVYNKYQKEQSLPLFELAKLQEKNKKLKKRLLIFFYNQDQKMHIYYWLLIFSFCLIIFTTVIFIV